MSQSVDVVGLRDLQSYSCFCLISVNETLVFDEETLVFDAVFYWWYQNPFTWQNGAVWLSKINEFENWIWKISEVTCKWFSFFRGQVCSGQWSSTHLSLLLWERKWLVRTLNCSILYIFKKCKIRQNTCMCNIHLSFAMQVGQ